MRKLHQTFTYGYQNIKAVRSAALPTARLTRTNESEMGMQRIFVKVKSGGAGVHGDQGAKLPEAGGH